MVVDNDLDVVIGVVDDDICYAVYVFAVRHDGLLLASWSMPCLMHEFSSSIRNISLIRFFVILYR
jgi:hypothetical protein